MFSIGQKVRNFGVVAVVVGFHHTGDLLLVEHKPLQAPRRRITKSTRRWVADPAKCEPVEPKA